MTVGAGWLAARTLGWRRSARRVTAYRRLLVAVSVDEESLSAVDLACQLARETRAVISLIAVVEVPAELPLGAHMRAEEKAARHVLKEAQAVAAGYGIGASARIIRGREAGAEIINAARRGESEIIVLSAQRRQRLNPHAPIFGRTVAFVLKHASCRVMVVARHMSTTARAR